jgi:hypothetical protein
MAWINDYKPTNYGMSFDVVDGDHRIKITKAREDMTKTQKPMIVVEYAVQGSNGVPFVDRIVSGEYFDSNMTRFFDAFKIDRGNFNFAAWSGKEATAHFEHRVSEYVDNNGQNRTTNKAEMTRLYTPDNAPQSTAPTSIPIPIPIPYGTAPVQNQSEYADFKEDIPDGVF